MKKFLSVLLAVLLIISIMPMGLFSITASAATSGKTGNCTWSLDGTVLTISGNGKMQDYSYSGEAPWGTEITNVVVESDVTYIGSRAFSDCTELTSAAIPNSVTRIGNAAFYCCTGLTIITIPDSVTSIGETAFYRCTGLKKVYISDMTAWLNISFGDNSSNPLYYSHDLYLNDELVTNLVIPNGITSIKPYAFSGWLGLTSITIPDSVTSINRYAFLKCAKLERVYIADITAWCNIKFENEFSNPLYYANNLYLNGELVTDLVIPNDVTSICGRAFYGYTGLASILIPNSVKLIGQSAFDGCSGLERVYITDMTGWLNITFGDYLSNPLCYAHDLYLNGKLVTNLVIPDGVIRINRYAFYGNTSLISIMIPNSVKYIGQSAFDDCSGLERVYITDMSAWCNISFFSKLNYYQTSNPLYYAHNLYLNGELVTNLVIPNGVTSINNHAFYGCTSLTSVTVPDSVTRINMGAFENCSNLKNIYITDIMAWCNIEFENYYSIKPNPLYSAHNLYLNGELVTNLVIPDGVVSVNNYAFYYCTGLTSITIPDSVTSIDNNAFTRCDKLETITFGNGMTKIQSQLFESNSKIKKIYIPKSITIIYNNAFAKANNITDIYYGGTEEEWKNVVIQHSNGSLATATVHYNCTGLPEYTPGDLDGDEGITDSDVLYLLKHTFRPEKYPVNQPCDYNGDGEITDADAVYLLKHIFRPEKYPLTK